jgi:hypothetical protein
MQIDGEGIENLFMNMVLKKQNFKIHLPMPLSLRMG